MIFTDKQDKNQVAYYTKLLKVLGSLSKLFSDSSTPYLNYRISENLFCLSFNAMNLTRSDISADAAKDTMGIGLKTFLENNGRSFQKVAEFNKDRHLYKEGSPKEIVEVISNLRNERILATKRIHNFDSMLYHCIVRSPSKMKIYEEEMHLIQQDSIKDIKLDRNAIIFNDGINDYSFNLSKSTLLKRFNSPTDYKEVEVKILPNPFDTIEDLLSGEIKPEDLIFLPTDTEKEYILLPLYSDRNQKVEEKSGLNQWNAAGRPRNPDEVYIPIPASIHHKFPDFFPDKDTSFEITLQNGETISAKLCQAGNKGLMSNPNTQLGKWILRDVLNLKEGHLVTMEMLQKIGLDSVVIYKEGPLKYSMNFKKVGSFQKFKEEQLTD